MTMPLPTFETDETSWLHLRDAEWLERFEELPGLCEIEFRIRRFDADEKAVAAGEREDGHVEQRVIRLRQPVQREHPEDRGEARAQHRRLKRDGDPRRPTVQGPTGDDERIAD